MGEGRTLSFSAYFQCFNFTAKEKQKHGRSICKFNCEIINSTGFLSSLLPSCERIPRSCVGSNHQSRTESGYSGFNWPECDHHILYNEFSLQHCVSSFTLESISVWFLIHDGSHQHHCILSLQSHGQFSAFLCLLRHPYKVLSTSTSVKTYSWVRTPSLVHKALAKHSIRLPKGGPTSWLQFVKLCTLY